jgi:hypothetical protein
MQESNLFFGRRPKGGSVRRTILSAFLCIFVDMIVRKEKDLADIIKAAMKASKHNKLSLSSASGVQRSGIYGYLSGKKSITMRTFVKLMAAMNYEVDMKLILLPPVVKQAEPEQQKV